MYEIIIGSLILSITHALIPNHWFPLAAISKTEKWNRKETLLITAISGFAHITSTIIIGIIVGFVGYQLSNKIDIITSTIAPALLFLIGLFYIILNVIKSSHHHHRHIDLEQEEDNEKTKKSKFTIILTLITMMFFSPCIEIEAYYFTAGALGWAGIITLSFIYLVVTVSFMIFLVDLGRRSLDKLSERLNFLDKYERAITGIVLILLSIFTYLIKQ
jgi:nickel/cobalt exporter